MRRFLFLFVLLLPACGGGSGTQENAGPEVQDPDLITVDAQNDDLTPYDIELDELTNGTVSARARILWPIASAGASPSTGEGTWDFHQDSATYSHAIVLYSTGGALIESTPFVKGAGQLLLMVTISGSKMSVSP